MVVMIRKILAYCLALLCVGVLYNVQIWLYGVLDPKWKVYKWLLKWLSNIVSSETIREIVAYYIPWLTILAVITFLYSVVIVKICSCEIIRSRIINIALISMWPAIFFVFIPELNVMTLPSILSCGVILYISLCFLCK